MASYIKRGEKLLIPFRNGISIGDSQCKPRIYKTRTAFRRNFPGYYLGTEDVELVEYAEVVHGRWIPLEYDGYADGNPVWDLWECSECREEHSGDEDTLTPYCPNCGAKMDGGNEDG